MTDEERRRTPRYRAEFNLALEPPDDFIVEGTVRDVSAGGFFIGCKKRTLAPETTVKVSAMGIDHQIFSFGAKVRRVDEDGGTPTMGLEFIEVGTEALLALRKHLVGAEVLLQVSSSDESLDE